MLFARLNRAIVLVLACAITLFSGCAEHVITPNASFQFQSDEQQHEFERRALAGDIQAARASANYYMFLRDDYKTAAYWLKAAAAHGDKTANHDIKVITRRD